MFYEKMKIVVIIIILFLIKNFAPTENELVDTNWNLVSVSSSAFVELADTSCRTTLHFENEEKYNGYSGCNWFYGDYFSTAKGQLTMNNPMRTKKGCIRNCDLGEELFNTFPKIINYKLNGDTLKLLTTDSIKIIYLKVK